MMLMLRAASWSCLSALLALGSEVAPDLQKLRQSAYELVQNKNYAEARQRYEELRTQALRRREPRLALQALSSIGGCYFGLYQYRKAIQVFDEALAEARRLSSQDLESLIAINVVSLNASLGDTAQAIRVLREYPMNGSSIGVESRLDWFTISLQAYARAVDRQSFEAVLPHAKAEVLGPVPAKLQEANAERYRKWPEAYGELRRAWLFDVLADAYEDFGEYRESLRYAADSYRIRATYRDPQRFRALIQQSFLQRKLGNPEEAWKLSEAVVKQADAGLTPMQSFRLHRERALILMGQAKPSEALVEFRKAMQYPRMWRSEVLPADSTILHFEKFMNGEIQQEFLDAIGALPEEKFTRELAEESFWVAEEARFSSLRAAFLARDEIAKRLGESYWPLLRRFQDLQAQVLAGNARAVVERDRIEGELQRQELRAGLSIPHAGSERSNGRLEFAQWQRKIPPDECVFAFHLSEPYSLGWAVTAKGIEMRRLEGRKALDGRASQFVEGLQKGVRGQGGHESSRLTKELFGEFSYPHRTKPFWTVVVEDTLARIPMSALPLIDDPSRFLVEAHAIRLLAAATMLGNGESTAWQRKAYGVADPVYNAADARGWGQRKASGSADWELNRLPGTMRETQQSFAVLGGWETHISAGMEANAVQLRTQTTVSPDILHIATHFTTDPERRDLLSIALSGTAGGRPSLFSAKDLTALRTRAKLVALDGCASASGEAYSGLGIVGLSRAWLISGAANVVGTLWPIPDVSGPFFPNFYSRIAKLPYSSRSISLSLRETQLDLLRRKDHYAAPRYWAAYILLQRS